MPWIHPLLKTKKLIEKLPSQVRAIDFGAGNAEWIKKQAKKHPNEIHLATDTDYIHKRKLSRKNVVILPSMSEDVVEMMKKRGKKTKFAVVRMPIPGYVLGERDLTGLRKIITEAKNLLIKNGSLVITTESDSVEKYILNLAKENKLSVRKRQLRIPETEWEKRRMKDGKTIQLFILKLK